MEQIGSRTFWIIGVMTLMMTFGKVFGGSICLDGDKYGYKTSQESAITKKNDNSSYLSGTVWHSKWYGMFSCCGVIKAIEVMISNTSDIQFQVWNITVPVTKTATFLSYYRTHVDIQDGVTQTITIPFDKQLPIRDGNAIGWIADVSDVIMWGDGDDLGDAADSDYLWEDFSEWSTPSKVLPPSFSTFLNQHTFSNNGLEGRVFGVRPVVHPGYTAKIDNLPLSVILYTTVNKVGEVLYNFSISGIPPLEESIYITVDVQMNRYDNFLAWNNSTKQVTLNGSIKSAMQDQPYEVTFTVRGGCNGDQTATLYVYAFDDDRREKDSGCYSKEIRPTPPSYLWNQDQTEEFPAAVVMLDKRWAFPGMGLLEAIEVCVSEPGSIDVFVWKETSRIEKEYRLLWRYTIKVTEVGCPAPFIIIPPEQSFQGNEDYFFGWASTSNTSILKFRELPLLPATKDYMFANLSDEYAENYDTVGNLYSFQKSGHVNRDYGIRFYVGPGVPPTITGLPNSIEIDVSEYKIGDVISFKYEDENTFQKLELSCGFFPRTQYFAITDDGKGHANITVRKDLHDIIDTRYTLQADLSDTCVIVSKDIPIAVVAIATSTSTTTTTKPSTTTTKPTTTTTKPTTTTTKPTTTTTKPTTTTTKPTTTTTKPTTTTTKPTTSTTATTMTTITRNTAATGSCVSLIVLGVVGFVVALCHTFT